jgi:hypothetical protein
MQKWIKNIIPRIQHLSIDLDKKELLVDRVWIWLGFDNMLSTWHFLRDNRLLITKSGNVEEGKWELHPGGLLQIQGQGFNYMFEHGILFEGVLIIKKLGVEDYLEVFYDVAVIPSGDVVGYVNMIESQRKFIEIEKAKKADRNESRKDELLAFLGVVIAVLISSLLLYLINNLFHN